MFEVLILLVISVVASSIGALTGVGGGILMKPLIDAFGFFTVSTTSFLSGCTVLTMCTVSLWRGRKSEVNIDMKTATPLAIGAVVGGILGNFLFEFASNAYGNDTQVGIIQSVILFLIVVAVLVYCRKKDGIQSFRYDSLVLCVAVGLSLGVISAFLGIGGGPMNLAVLFLFFSMRPKEAARTSLYIIFCSQMASLIMSIATGTVPSFEPVFLIVMMIGGVMGGLIGAKFTTKLSEKQIDISFQVLLVVIMFVVSYNIYQFAMQL